MPFSLLDEAIERRSGAKSPGTARRQITPAESKAYGRMVGASQEASRGQTKSHSLRASQILENRIGYAIGCFRD